MRNSVGKKRKKYKCPFCNVKKSKILFAFKTYSNINTNIYIIKSEPAIAETHYLVIPESHCENNYSFMDQTYWFWVFNFVYTKKLKNFSILINFGKNKTIKHNHLHILAGKMK